MLKRQGGCIVWECDMCGAALETETADFGKARRALERERWQSEAHRADHYVTWTHLCDACKE